MRPLLALCLTAAPLLLGHELSVPPELLKRVQAMRTQDSFILVSFSNLPAEPASFRPSPTEPDLSQRWATRRLPESLPLSAVLGRDLKTYSLGGMAWLDEHKQPRFSTRDPLLQLLLVDFRGPGWILLNDRLKAVAHGHESANPLIVLEAMRSRGWHSQREAREAYLRNTPLDGHARLEHLRDLLRQMASLHQDGVWNNTLATALLSPMERPLHELKALPDLREAWAPGIPSPLLALPPALESLPEGSRAGWDALVSEVKTEVLASLEEDPASPSAWQLALRWPGGSPSLVPLLDGLPPLPGGPWPPPDMVPALIQQLPVDAPALQALALRIIEGTSPGLRRREAALLWGPLAFRALATQGPADALPQLVEPLRSAAGSHWPSLAATLTRLAETPGPIPAPLRAALQQPPVPDAATPVPPPLRLVRLKTTEDALAWVRLQTDPLLEDWSPRELDWTPAGEAERRRIPGWSTPLTAQPGGQRWALLQGSQVLAHGEGLPTASRLQSLLRTWGTPGFEPLRAFLALHPRRRDAVLAALGHWRQQLPAPRAAQAMVDAAAPLELPLGALPPLPAETVEPTALGVCHRLSARLSHWPFQSRGWEAVADWTELAPTAPRLLQLLAQTPSWPYLDGEALPGPWPPEVILPALEALARGRRWTESLAVFRHLWAQGLHTWLRRRTDFLGDASLAQDPALQNLKPLFRCWEAALQGGAAMAERQGLHRTLDALAPGLAKLLTGS